MSEAISSPFVGPAPLDPDEYREWHEDAVTSHAMYLGSDATMYFPGDKELPEEGGWIFVTDPPTNVALDFEVPVLSLWYAIPHRLESGRIMGVAPHQAIIITPAGNLHLWPHEYTPCKNPSGIVGMDGSHIHRLGGGPGIDSDTFFYLRSRGIPPEEAASMLLGEVERPDFAYVTFDDWVVEAFKGVGVPLWKHVRDNPRS